MSGQYAVIDSAGKISNIILWDGESEWQPPEGLTPVACKDGECLIGGSYSKGKFFPPEPEPVTQEELLSQAQQQKTKLMEDAGTKIAVLQDAVSLDMATQEEQALLTALQKYRVLLNRVDVSTAPEIDWPEKTA